MAEVHTGKCIACGKNAEFPIRALEVRTLHIRDLGGERRVQALGDFVDSSVCRRCSEEKKAQETSLSTLARKRLILFGIIMALGLLAGAVGWFALRHQVITILGCMTAVAGILAILGTIRDGSEKVKAMNALSPEEALEEAAWDVFLAHAPQKEGDHSLTYIPVNARSLQRKNGDLMILYNLLPEIAKEAWNRLHGVLPSQETTSGGG